MLVYAASHCNSGFSCYDCYPSLAFVNDPIVPCGIERLHGDRPLLIGVPLEPVAGVVACGNERRHGKWLIVMCCDTTDDHLCVSIGCLWARASTCGKGPYIAWVRRHAEAKGRCFTFDYGADGFGRGEGVPLLLFFVCICMVICIDVSKLRNLCHPLISSACWLRHKWHFHASHTRRADGETGDLLWHQHQPGWQARPWGLGALALLRALLQPSSSKVPSSLRNAWESSSHLGLLMVVAGVKSNLHLHHDTWSMVMTRYS